MLCSMIDEKGYFDFPWNARSEIIIRGVTMLLGSKIYDLREYF